MVESFQSKKGIVDKATEGQDGSCKSINLTKNWND